MSHDLADTVRDALEGHARALEVRTPSWQELEAGLGRVRRSRRRARVARVGGMVAALALVAGGVQGGVLPYPTWAPAISMAASPSALDTGVVRGSLAGDTAWLAALREVVARRSLTEKEGTWQVSSPDDVHVLYASDAGSFRVALVEMRMRAGLLEARQQVWYAGPRGAAADRLEEQSGGQPQDRDLAWFDAPDAGSGEGVLVVVAADPEPYLLAQPPEYGADGTVHRDAPRRLEPGADGVIEEEIPAGVETTVTVSPATKPYAWDLVRPGQAEATDVPPTPRTFADGRAVPAEGRVPALIDSAVATLVAESGLASPPSSALWAGPLGAWTGVAVAVTAPSGARLVHVQTEAPDPGRTDAWRDRSVFAVLPAGELTDVALAWQLAEAADEGAAAPVRGVGVLGPVGATSARLADGTARPAEVTLTHRAGLLPAPGEGHERAEVQFVDAAGRVLATVDVLPLDTQLPTGLQ